MKIRNIAIVLVAVIVAGCGGGDSGGGSGSSGGGSSPPPDAKPGGSYTGSFNSNETGETVRVDGLVLETGEAMFLSQYGIYTANIQTNGNDIDTAFEGFALFGSTWDGVNSYLIGNIDGTVSERSGMTGEYTLGSDNGTFALSYETDIYEQTSFIIIESRRQLGLYDHIDRVHNFSIDRQ